MHKLVTNALFPFRSTKTLLLQRQLWLVNELFFTVILFFQWQIAAESMGINCDYLLLSIFRAVQENVCTKG